MKKITRKNLVPFLKKYSTDKKVLDVGGGRADFNHSYDVFFPNRFSVDIDPKREPDLVADVHNLPIKDNTYEFVLCTEVIEHCHDPQKAVNEMMRVLKPGGTCVLTTRFMFPIHDFPHDYWRFTEMQMQKLFENSTIIELRSETETMSCVAAILQRILFQVKFKFANRLLKVPLLALVWIFDHSNWLIREEFADIKHENRKNAVFTTGYYIAVQKPH